MTSVSVSYRSPGREAVPVRILRGIGRHREIKRLRRSAHEAPTPGAFETLAARCIALDRVEEALAAAREGMALFPNSVRLESIQTFAQRTLLKSRIEELQKERSAKPSPAVFNKLADVYLEIGDYDQAIRICSSCVRHFPMNEHPYFVLGQIRLRRFFIDRISLDGLDAERQLMKVLSLNGGNGSARLLLAHLYFTVGAIPEMREHLKLILASAPDRKDVRDLLEAENYRHPGPETSDEENEDEEAAGWDETFSVHELVLRAESSRHFVNAPHDFALSEINGLAADAVETPIPSETLLDNLLGSIVTEPGIRAAAFVDQKGEAIASRVDDEAPGTPRFPDLAAEILRTAVEAGRRMDLGAFHWCTVEGPFGGISIAKVRDVHLAADYAAPMKTGQAHTLLEDLAARAYSPAMEAADA